MIQIVSILCSSSLTSLLCIDREEGREMMVGMYIQLKLGRLGLAIGDLQEVTTSYKSLQEDLLE